MGIECVRLRLIGVLCDQRSAEGPSIYCCWIHFQRGAVLHDVWVGYGKDSAGFGGLEHLFKIDCCVERFGWLFLLVRRVLLGLDVLNRLELSVRRLTNFNEACGWLWDLEACMGRKDAVASLQAWTCDDHIARSLCLTWCQVKLLCLLRCKSLTIMFIEAIYVTYPFCRDED